MSNENKKTQLIAGLLQHAHQQNDGQLSYAVPNIFSKKLASMALIREDILFVKDAFTKLKISKEGNNRDETIELSLFFAAISQYGRCFNSNQGGHSKLEPGDLFGADDQNFKNVHDELIELRNSYVAHRDDTEYEQAVVIMKIPVEGNEEGITFNVKSAKTASTAPENIESYIGLCDFILPKIQAKIQSNSDKTRDGLFKNLSPEHINMLRIS